MGVDEHSHGLGLLAVKPRGLVNYHHNVNTILAITVHNSGRHAGHIGFIPHHHMVPH